jgi:DNA-binding MarR family transcriptional regulator
MKLEDEIKQKKFKSDFEKAIINIIYTGGWIGLKQSDLLKPFGITIQQYNVLRILRGQYPNPATVNLIIDRMLDKMSNASRIVDRLVAKNLVERKICPNDRRSVDVKITDEGLKILEKLDIEQNKWVKGVNKMNLKETKQLNNLLDKMRALK